MSGSGGIKKAILKDTGKYSSAQYFCKGIGFVTAIAIRRFLGPYFMGIWSLLQVVQGYLSYLSFGVNSAAVYNIPFFKGKGDRLSEEETRDTAFTFLFIVSIVSCLGLVAAAIIMRHSYPKVVIIGLLALGLYIILDRFFSYYVITLRAYKNFSVLTRSLLFDSVTTLLLVFLLVRQFKIYGFYVAVSLMAVLNVLFVHRLARYRINLGLNPQRLKKLIKLLDLKSGLMII